VARQLPGTALAIIPARGGSKGIPHKNIQTVGGIPLIGRTIGAAKSAQSIGRVIVTTDSASIARVASQYGAEIVERPDRLAGDIASSEAALLHAIDVLEAAGSSTPDIIVFLQCTSPFTMPQDIDDAIEKLIAENADCCFSAVSTHGFLWKQSADGNAIGINHDGKSRLMRQQREEEFLETGALYVMRSSGFKSHKFRFFGKTVIQALDPQRAMEIDTPADLALARALAPTLDTRVLSVRTGGTAIGKIRALAMDFDGVFTDDRVTVDQNGTESVTCSRSDGFGLEALAKTGIEMVVISREKNAVVAARCRKLGIPVHHGIDDKISIFRDWCRQRNLSLSDVAYVGNDLPDIECLQAAGLAIAPKDAHPLARLNAHIVLENPGGRGCLRELAALWGV
jgi:N-acylneuraminate cytidylyltransferase